MATVEPFYIWLGLRVARFREASGLTQTQLAQRLTPPVTRASVANIENGKQRVLAHTVIQLSKALRVTEAELFGTKQARAANRHRVGGRDG